MRRPSFRRRASQRGGLLFSLALAALAVLAIGALWYGFLRGGDPDGSGLALTPPLERGSLRVTVVEAGSLESLASEAIVNQVEGRTTIDYVVPEGTIVTPEDVSRGMVLVRLNTAEIEEKRVRQEIEHAAAVDDLANAKTNLEIQLQQNASDIRKAELDVRFALLDIERYVGKVLAGQLLGALGDTGAADGMGQADGTGQGEGEGAAAPGEDTSGMRRLVATLLDSPALEGEALQTVRQIKSDIQLAGEELRRAEERLKNSVKLHEKGYISQDEYDADKLALERRRIEVERSATAEQQFVQYDFPKEVATLLSDVIEARDRLSREIKKGEAAEAQKRSAVTARLKEEELKRRRLQNYRLQEENCVIRATVPGLVLYASSGNEHRWGNDDRIQEGASVRQGQTLLTIPSPDGLGAKVNVHETAIDRVREGQRAWIEVDALPGVRLPARVASVSRLPNPADRWLNPDLKVYATTIAIDGRHEDLKPGMSAQVEILIDELPDVIAVPVQAVAGTAKDPVAWVWEDGRTVRRPVTLGLASEHFVEIRSGLAAGDRVRLDPPREERAPQGGADTPVEADAGGDATPPPPAPPAGRPSAAPDGDGAGPRSTGAPPRGGKGRRPAPAADGTTGRPAR